MKCFCVIQLKEGTGAVIGWKFYSECVTVELVSSVCSRPRIVNLHKLANPSNLGYRPLGFHFEPLKLLNFGLFLMRISRIQLLTLTLIRIRIRKPAANYSLQLCKSTAHYSFIKHQKVLHAPT